MATYDGTQHDGAVGAATSSQSSMLNPDLGMSIHRYGSLEQSNKRGRVENIGDYLNSMNNTGHTPRPSPPPRRGTRSPRPRTRSRDDEDRRRDRRDDREEHRRDRDDRDEPVGIGFRLTACETSLKEHHAEIAAHRVTLHQLGEEMKRQIADTENHRQRLDAVFALVDQRFKEGQQYTQEAQQKSEISLQAIHETQVAAQDSFNTLHTKVNNISQGLAARIEQIMIELAVLRREAREPPSPQNQSNPSTSNSAPPAPPDMPQSAPSASPGMAAPPGVSQPAPSAPPGMSANHNVPPSWSGYHATGNDHGPSAQGHDSRESFFIGSPLGGNRSRSDPNGQNQNFDRPTGARFEPSPDRSPEFGGPFGNSGPSPSMAGAGTQNRPFDPRDWSTDGKKISKELRTFDGDLATFDTWRMRVRNHFVGANCNYSRIFELIETNKTPIKWATLARTQIADLPYLDWQWIATHLWTFTGNYLSDSQLTRRAALVGGEEFNGLEYWRALYSENVGGSTQLANLERGHFIAFPNCSNIAELEPHLKQWTQLKHKYGHGLPEEHLIGMLWSIIPEGMKEEIKKQRELAGNLDGQISWVFSEIAERTDNKLSKWNLSKLQRQLKTQPRNTTGIHAVGTNDEDNIAPPPPAPDMATFTATMERNLEKMVNAAIARTGRPQNRTTPGSRSSSNGSQRAGRRIPSASFKGCWCCGKEGHSRKDCPEFKMLKSKNGGKVPKDYVGAWERQQKAQASSTKVATVGVTPGFDDDDDHEYPETMIWPVLPMPSPAPTHNKYDSLMQSDDEDDDESEVMKALAALTPKVSLTSGCSSQKTRKLNHAKTKPMNVAHLKAIAKDVKDGKISLPDIDLSNDSEYTYVWALVDSGAGANVAKRSMFSETKPVSAPSISLSTANGESLPHSGAHRVISYNRDGSQVGRIFYDADVEMPILAVSELSREGRNGSEVRLRQRDGFIRDLQNGNRQQIVKRRGVYFTKMYIRKLDNLSTDSGFIRPGHP